MRVFHCTILLLLWAIGLPAQVTPQSGNSIVTGIVKDPSGAVVPNAQVVLSNDAGYSQQTQTGAQGTYTFRHIPPGNYSLAVTYTGLQQASALLITVSPGETVRSTIAMHVAENKEEVNVVEATTDRVTTDPANNASALVLREQDLAALPDDPDDLEADLEALAGPSAGPGGNQIFIDGFTGGRMPPKASIREIRINSNPFSAEYDKLGYGRIEILTKPGTDKFHGQGMYSTSDGIWNSRNPFLIDTPPFRTQMFGGNVSGPLTRKASFFVDVERRNIDDNGIINAKILNLQTLLPQADQTFYPTPQRRTTVSPRVDYQLNANNTLSMRYSYLDNDHLLTGISAFNLPGSGYSENNTEHLFQLVETAILNPHVINETHFQYARDAQYEKSQSDLPKLNVANSFISGGSGYSSSAYGSAYDTQNQYEIQNYTSMNYGAHSIKFGLRIRADVLDDYSPKNFNGAYTFQGSTGLSSLAQYQQTVALLNAGYTSQQVSAMGYGPSLYTVSVGKPYIGLSQLDFGPFVQDDWRIRPNLTVSAGLRWEAQTNISDKSDWAPRVSVAWAPGGGPGGRAKTVIRAGWGMFYDRFQATNVLTAERYNGENELNYVLYNPSVFNSGFTTAIPLSDLSLSNTEQRYEIDSHLHAPVLMQTVVGVERQLFGRTRLSVNFVNSRGNHLLRTVDINAPLPGTYPFGAVTTATNNLGIRPYGDVGDIYLYESSGIYKQTQLVVSLNTSIGKWGTLFGRYAYGSAHSDTDGLATLPANQYDFSSEYGRSSLDVRNLVFLGGSFAAPWGVRISPFFVAHSGIPFNITTGTDLYLTGQMDSTARPGIATGSGANIVSTPYGMLDTIPQPGQAVIERNAGNGPGFLELNFRLSKTWGFGTTKFEGPSGGSTSRQGGGPPGGGGPGGGHGGPGGGGPPGGGFGGPGGPPRMDSSTEHRFNLTAAIMARNILNHENLNTPNGALTSPYFLQSTGITGGFGPEATASNQRRIDLQLRFTF